MKASRLPCDAYNDGLGPDGERSCSVLWMVQYGRVSGKRDNHSSGCRSDNCGELGGVKSTPEIGANEAGTSIFDLHPQR